MTSRFINGQTIDETDYIQASTGASDAGKAVVTRDSDGLIDESFLHFAYGGGSDGDVTISAPTTLTRDMYYNNLVITDVLTTNGYKVFVKETVSGAGTIKWGVANNGGNASGSTAGAGGTANASGGTFYLNQAGGAGTNTTGNGNGGNGANPGLGVAGGNGGEGGGSPSGGTGGAVTAPVTKFAVFADLTLKGLDWLNTGAFGNIYKSSGGGGGGKGGYNGGAAGGGGASGGVVFLCAKKWTGTFTIMSVGGNGGNGSTTFNGGGGGGGGGVSIVIYNTKTWTGSYNLAGGSAGTQTNGVNPTAGTTGLSYEILNTSLTR